MVMDTLQPGADCDTCPAERDCQYPYKPCDCVLQGKFWDAERRWGYDHAAASARSEEPLE